MSEKHDEDAELNDFVFSLKKRQKDAVFFGFGIFVGLISLLFVILMLLVKLNE